jgi:hypothetical protein
MVEDPLMRIFVSRFYPRRSVLFAVLPLLSSKAVFAHERFIPHTFTAPLQEDFFQSLNWDMLNIGLRGIILIAMLMALWFLRRPLDDLIEPILLRNLPGRSRKLIRMGEIVTGFLLMVGVFCRVWCMLMLFMFIKLMVVDFGWAELPHLYFMSIFLVLLFSNRLSGDFAWIERRTAAAAWDGKMARALLIAVAIALFLSTLVVYPGLYVLTKIPNSSVFGDYASGIEGGT